MHNNNQNGSNLGYLIFFLLIVFGFAGLILPLIGMLDLYTRDDLSINAFIMLLFGTLALNLVVRSIGIIIAKAQMGRKSFQYSANEFIAFSRESNHPLTGQSVGKFLLVSLLITSIAGSVSYLNGQTITVPLLGFIVWLLLLWWMPKLFKTHMFGMMFQETRTKINAIETTSTPDEQSSVNGGDCYWITPKRAGSMKVCESLLDAHGNVVVNIERMKHGNITVSFHHAQHGAGGYYLESPSHRGADCQVLNNTNETIASIGPVSLPTCTVTMKNHDYKEHVLKRSVRLFKEHRETHLDDAPLFTFSPQKFNDKPAVMLKIHQPEKWDLAIVLAIGTLYRGML